MSLSRTLQYAFIAIVTLSVGFSLYQWNASRASTNKTAPNNGLVGYWSFNEGTGTLAGDASGNGNTGTLTNGPTWVAGKLGQALSFDGVNDYVFLGNVSTEAVDYTVSLWYWYLQGSTAGDVFSRGRSSACFYNPRFYVDASGWLPIESGCSGDGYLNVVPLHNGWNHLVMTRSGQTAKTYLDGVLKQTDGSQPGGLGTNNSKTLIGNEYVSYSPDVFAGTLSGSVDEVRIYNRALSGTEVTNLYNLGAAKLNTSPTASLTSGLVGYWTFDGKDTPWSSSSAGTATDRSGNSNTGTLTNMSRATSPVEGKIGQALNFDGTDDYVNLTSPPNFQDNLPYTVAGWVKTTSGGILISTWNGGVSPGMYIIIGATSQILMTNVNGSSFRRENFATSVLDGSWHQIVVTYTGNSDISGYSFYFDSISVTGTSPVNTSPGALPNSYANIGRSLSSGVGSQYFNGLIDEVRIYNRALSATEIASLYNNGKVVLNYTKKIYITTPGAGTFSAPVDWPGVADKVEVIGGGAAGGWGSYWANPGSGGGGGAYARKSNVAISNGASLQVGSGGLSSGGAGGDTWIVSSGTVKAAGAPAHAYDVAGTGGSAGSSVGDLVYSGGSGGSTSNHYSIGGGGGGGAAGPRGAGKNGGYAANLGCCNGGGGAGGGGAGGGSSTAGSDSTNGGPAGTGAAGGTAQDGTAGGAAGGANGSHGSGGGGGGNAAIGGQGGAGVEWDSAHGAGGGGGGGGAGGSSYDGGAGGVGGSYGGGGGGGGQDGHQTPDYNDGGAGGQGIIVITYTPS